MKKSFLIITVVSIVLVMAFPQMGVSRTRENLYTMLNDVKEVKTYIADIIDSSQEAKDMLSGIKKNIENALATRMTINFVLVPDEKDADLVITCDIVERIWLDHDPIDQPSLSGAAIDAAIDEDYGRIQAIFIVKKGEQKKIFKRVPRKFKRKDILWQQKIQATITKGEMSEEESKPLLEERLAKMFMRECFSKSAKM